MLEIALYNSRQHQQFRRELGPVVLARTTGEPSLWTAVRRGAESPNALVEIIPQPGGVSLAMAGCEAECHCGRSCSLTGNCQLPLPANFTIGDTRFEISAAESASPRRALQKLHHESRDRRNHESPVAGPSPVTLARWFAALSSLNHRATSLQELYVQVAHCAVEAIGLDGGIVLRRRDGEWEIAASHLPNPELGIHCEMAILDELLISPQTLFHGFGSDASDEPSVVVSPLRNAAGELAGAVHGLRSVREGNGRRTIRFLEAHMIELLAGAASEGIARIERETETERRRVLLEQAAASSQKESSRMIRTEEREVTLLFADLRDSTSLSTALLANESYELLSQVMDCLTAAVLDLDGLVIDYYGDGLAAMWNAPADQSDHAELACRAAQRMLQVLPDISSDWSAMIHRELQLGIGIHTGLAHVGNTGSRRRTKYGPRGTNVHVASRVEVATKQLSVPLLTTEATATRLSNRFAAHRLCRARMPGFVRPIDLYGVCSTKSDAASLSAWQSYDEALRCFERGRLKEAVEILAKIDANLTEIPSQFLIQHMQRELSRQHRRRSTDRETENGAA